MKEFVIGTKAQFTTFPAEVEVDGKPYFLVEEDGKFTLLFRICPHAGAVIDYENGELECPMHGWTFDVHSGRCLNVPSAELMNYEVQLREDNLVVQMS